MQFTVKGGAYCLSEGICGVAQFVQQPISSLCTTHVDVNGLLRLKLQVLRDKIRSYLIKFTITLSLPLIPVI